MLFQFYDDKNKLRLVKLKQKAQLTKKLTKDLQELTNTVLSILKKISSMNSLNKIHTNKVDNLFISPEAVKDAFQTNLLKRMEDIKSGVEKESTMIDTKPKRTFGGAFSALNNI